MLVDGQRVAFDRLVLACGSIPTLPPIRGLVRRDGTLDPRVHAFRTLDDCRRLDAATRSLVEDGRGRVTRPRAVVVGGGLLGLQVARALAVRGLLTEVVEGADHLLASQVGSGAGAVLARDLRRLGTEVYTGARAVRLTGDGLRLDNGYVLPSDLVVLTAGGRPSTALARRAGLMVRRGVVVDHTLSSVTDDRVHAIGDCAEHRRRTTGFVPPAWEQAEVLARVLRGEEATYDGSRSVARLRATGLDVAVLGDPERAEGEVVEVTNPITGSHRRLVVHGGRIVAAALVGDLSRVGLITQLYDRGHPARPRRARSAAPARGGGRPGAAARRGGGLRVRRRDRGRGPGLRVGGRVRRPDPGHDRLRRVRGRRTPPGRGQPDAGRGRLTTSPHVAASHGGTGGGCR